MIEWDIHKYQKKLFYMLRYTYTPPPSQIVTFSAQKVQLPNLNEWVEKELKMKTDQTETSVDLTREAIIGSIVKWKDICNGIGIDHGARNCPLCALFYSKQCENCPVKLYTGIRSCQNTPYDDWCEHHLNTYHHFNTEHSNRKVIYCTKCADLARKEKAFLYNVLNAYDSGQLTDPEYCDFIVFATYHDEDGPNEEYAGKIPLRRYPNGRVSPPAELEIAGYRYEIKA